MDPVRSSTNPSNELSKHAAEESTAASSPQLQVSQAGVCPVDPLAPSDAVQDQAVRSLLEAYARPPVRLPTETSASGSATPRTDNNAARTSTREAPGAYAASGYTQSGDGVFAGVAALKQHDSKSGADVEVFTASAQFGAQNELQAGLARVAGTIPGDHLDVNLSAEVLTARLNGGIYNDDDSYGANLGASLTSAGVEATAAYSGWSGTVGLSASIGAAVSSGDRNIDGDETPERCFKGSVGPLTLGVCTEF
jgi:hypothetical protein